VAGELGFDTGPYVSVATFCERVLAEKDEVLSIIRAIDVMNVQADGGPDVPDALPEGTTVQTTLVLLLKAGQAAGPQAIKFVVESPDGTRKDSPERSFMFSPGPAGGLSLIVPMAIALSSAGLYWVHVFVNNRVVTRVPLTVNYTFTRGSGAPL
jgi:hypothetical protein